MFRKFAVALLIVALSSPIYAQSVTVDVGKLNSTQATQVLEAKKAADAEMAKTNPTVTMDAAKQWADAGANVAKAVASAAKELSMSITDFLNTPIGNWTALFVIVYFFGAKIWTIGAGIVIWIVLGTVIWQSFRLLHRPRNILVSRTPTGKWPWQVTKVWDEKEPVWASDENRQFSAFMHMAAFIVLSAIMLFKIL